MLSFINNLSFIFKILQIIKFYDEKINFSFQTVMLSLAFNSLSNAFWGNMLRPCFYTAEKNFSNEQKIFTHNAY